MYTLQPQILNGVNTIVALQGYPNMPGVSDVIRELDCVCSYIRDSERFYAVPFRKRSSSHTHFEAIDDAKGHFEEFYFGGNQLLEFGFKPRALYRLVIEPLLDSMAELSHDDVLDAFPNVIEQIKEHVHMAERKGPHDAAQAYKTYQQIAAKQLKDKRIREITTGVMKLRKKTLALQREIQRAKKR